MLKQKNQAPLRIVFRKFTPASSLYPARRDFDIFAKSPNALDFRGNHFNSQLKINGNCIEIIYN